MAKSKPKKPRKTLSQRVEVVLERAMHDYADYRVENRGYWAQFPREHSAFSRARRSILRLLREVARG